LNKTLTKTLDPALDLSGVNTIKYDIRASRTGSNIKIGIYEGASMRSEHTANISQADTFETQTWDISGVSDANKNAIDKIVVTIVNVDAANTFYIDNFGVALILADSITVSDGYVTNPEKLLTDNITVSDGYVTNTGKLLIDDITISDNCTTYTEKLLLVETISIDESISKGINARTISDAGGNWSDTSTWVEGEVPTTVNDVIATNTSGNLTIDVTANCKSADFTNYTGTLTHNANKTINMYGSLKFVDGMTYTLGNASTSAINIRTGDLTCAGKTLGNITILGTLTLQDTLTSSGRLEINGGTFVANNQTVVLTGSIPSLTGAFTFYNLTRTGNAAKTDTLALYNDITVTNTLTLNGNSATNRLLVYSNTIGTARTLTAATVSCSNVDFMDITGAGEGDWNLSAISGLSGDCGGNSGITFTTADTCTWLDADGGNWSDAGNWDTTTATDRVPLPQDDVEMGIAYNTSKTVAADMPRLGKSIDWTGATWTTALTWGGTTARFIYGSLTLVSGLTYSPESGPISFQGRGTYTIDTDGVSTYGNWLIQSVGGSYTLQSNISNIAANSQTFYIDWGTFDANDYNVTIFNLGRSINGVALFLMGSGTWTLWGYGAATWNLPATNLTFNAETSTIVISDTGSSSKTFAGGGQIYHNLSITGGGTGEVIFTGSNTFNTLTINKPKTIKFTTGTITNITGGFVALGDGDNAITINSVTNDLAYVIKKKYAGAHWYVGENSTNTSGNTGLTFEVDPDGYMDYCVIRDLTGELLPDQVLSEEVTTLDIGTKDYTIHDLDETVTTTDDYSRVLSWIRLFLEDVTISEAVTSSHIQYVSLLESIVISDPTATWATTWVRTLLEDITLTDGTTLQTVITKSETINLTDLVTRVRSIQQLISESVTVTDRVANKVEWIRELIESMSLSEIAFFISDRDITLFENIAISEAKQMAINKLISDSIIASETTPANGPIKNVTETITISEDAETWLKHKEKTFTWTTGTTSSSLWTLVPTSTDTWT